MSAILGTTYILPEQKMDLILMAMGQHWPHQEGQVFANSLEVCTFVGAFLVQTDSSSQTTLS